MIAKISVLQTMLSILFTTLKSSRFMETRSHNYQEEAIFVKKKKKKKKSCTYVPSKSIEENTSKCQRWLFLESGSMGTFLFFSLFVFSIKNTQFFCISKNVLFLKIGSENQRMRTLSLCKQTSANKTHESAWFWISKFSL